MDIVATAPGATTLFVDATVRHPASCGGANHSQYRHAATVDGTAAAAAEKDKTKRYPPCGGCTVRTAAMESYGRMGPDLLALLGELQAHVGAMSGLTGSSSGRCATRWFAILGTALVRGIAHSIITSVELSEQLRPHGGGEAEAGLGAGRRGGTV